MSWTKIIKAKLYNIEYVKPGDGISDFIGNIKVEANDEKEALAIAEQKRPDGWNFKIIDKNYENVDIVNKDSKVEHEYSSGYWDGYRYRTESKINKKASQSGSGNGHFEKDYDNVELIVNGEKKICSIYIDADYEFKWYKEEQTYWEPGNSSIESLDISINSINVYDNDGNEYDEKQCEKILQDNEKDLEDLIESDVETEAYESDWEEDDIYDY